MGLLNYFSNDRIKDLAEDIVTRNALDSDVSMKTHIYKTVSSCFAALRRLRSIRRSISQAVLLSLVTSLIMTRLDYGSAVLAGLPSHLLNRLQSVLNAAARLVCCARKYDHATHLLRDLHWLRVPERIQFRPVSYTHLTLPTIYSV